MTTVDIDLHADEAPVEPDPDATTVTQELIAIRQIANRLDGLDGPARTRVLHWVFGRYVGDLRDRVIKEISA